MKPSNQNTKTCIKCKEDFVWFPEESWWDYKNYTPAKLVKCPYCGCIQAVRYESEKNLNFDARYYK